MTYFFYDLETTGISASNDRIIQIAGQRVDADLEPVGAGLETLVSLSTDVIPHPEAIITNGVLPLEAKLNGVSEADLIKMLEAEAWQPETVFVGYASADFDDNFIRNLCYRNFVDPYAWQRQNRCLSWDLLPVVCLARDLRPEGINWPTKTGLSRPTAQLAALAAANGLTQPNHTAAVDVATTIDMARLIKQKQPHLFQYLSQARQPDRIRQEVLKKEPVVFSGHYYPGGLGLKTTVVVYLGTDPIYETNLLVYDLRVDPGPYLNMTTAQLRAAVASGRQKRSGPFLRLSPTKSQPLAPLSVVRDDADWQRLGLKPDLIESRHQALAASQIADQVRAAFEIEPARPGLDILNVDSYLYSGQPLTDADRERMDQVRQTKPADLNSLDTDFDDPRLRLLLPLYKARNWPNHLNSSERELFDKYLHRRWFGRDSPYSLAAFEKDIQRAWAAHRSDDSVAEILQELVDYISAQTPTQA